MDRLTTFAARPINPTASGVKPKHEGEARGLIRQAMGSPCHPLRSADLTLFESFFGRDLTAVRVHDDPTSADSAKALGSLAYTLGDHIFFAKDQYRPHTRLGMSLLGHELTHAAQHVNSPVEIHEVPISDPSEPVERQAQAVADSLFYGERELPQTARASVAIYRAPETWFRGEASGLGPARPGGAPHDLGDGLYLTDRSDVAQLYAETRAAGRATAGRVMSATFERRILGRVLDLTQDVRWQRFLQTRTPSGQTFAQLIRAANENYGRLFDNFVQANNINLAEYDAILGPEFVRGGTQLCIRTPAIADRVRAVLRQVPSNAPSASEEQAPPERALPPSRQTVEERGVATPAEAPPGTAQEAGGEFRVRAQFRILSSSTQPDGSFVSEVEVQLTEGLEGLNRVTTANGGRPLSSQMVIRVTQNAEGLLTAAESLTGEPTAVAEILAREAFSSLPRATGSAEAAAGAAAGATRAVSPWIRGIGWAGLVVFVALTAYQYQQAAPRDRPRVLATAAGGLVGSAASSYLVCNLLLGIETVGWSLLICAFIAGVPGGYLGAAAAGQLYDESALDPVERALRRLQSLPVNVRRLFYAMVAGSDRGLPVTEEFIEGFIAAVPLNLRDSELALLAASLVSVRQGDDLSAVLAALRRSLERLPGRGPRELPAMLDITDIGVQQRGGRFRIDAIGGGRIQLLPPVREPSTRTQAEDRPFIRPILEVQF